MFSELRQRLVEHYASLAMNPATVDHARFIVRQMQSDESGLWSGIGLQIKERIDEKKKQIQTQGHQT